jgi:hypothetical protein
MQPSFLSDLLASSSCFIARLQHGCTPYRLIPRPMRVRMTVVGFLDHYRCWPAFLAAGVGIDALLRASV